MHRCKAQVEAYAQQYTALQAEKNEQAVLLLEAQDELKQLHGEVRCAACVCV